MATVTRAKRRLGTFLHGARERADKTLTEAAAELKTAGSTVSRYEAGEMLPVWPTVLVLLNLYDAEEQQREEASQLWEVARNDPRPVRLPTGTLRTFRRMVSAEREADIEQTIELSVIPGLVQTENYMRSLLTGAHRFSKATDRADGVVSARLARQGLLEEADPLTLHAVVDEAAIRRLVGGPEVMREQLDYLLEIGAKPNVTIQVMPFGAGSYGPMAGGCIILGYDDDTAGVYLEYPAGGAWVENEEDVKCFTGMFEEAVHTALTHIDTADLIRRQLRTLDTDEQQRQVAQE